MLQIPLCSSKKTDVTSLSATSTRNSPFLFAPSLLVHCLINKTVILFIAYISWLTSQFTVPTTRYKSILGQIFHCL